MLAHRVFLTHNKLIRKLGHVGKKTRSCTVWNFQIAKIFPGLAGIFAGKMPSDGPKTLRRPLLVGPYFSSPSSVPREPRTLKKRVAQAFRRYQERRKPTSGARSNTRANTDKKQGKMGRRFDAFFLPGSRLCAHSLFDSLQVDKRAQVRWKDDDSGYDVQLSVHR